MKIPPALIVTILFGGCVVTPTSPEEAPPPANQQEIPGATMFDTLSSSIVWSHDESFLYTCGRSGLVQVERVNGTTRTLDPRVMLYEGITLSGSGQYLYCVVRPNFNFTVYSEQLDIVLRYRLSTFAADTIATGRNMYFIPSPVTDEIVCYYANEDSLVMVDPVAGVRRSLGAFQPLAYSPDGTDLLIGRYNDSAPFQVLHRDGTVSQQDGDRLSYPDREEKIVWGIDGIKILYSVNYEYGETQYSVFDLRTGNVQEIGPCYGWLENFSPDGTQITYWRRNVTEWTNLFIISVPSKADFIINITTFSTQSTKSYTIEHSNRPSSVSTGFIAIAPSRKQVAFIYNGLLKTMSPT